MIRSFLCSLFGRPAGSRVTAANIATGTYDAGRVTREAENAFTARYLLATTGTTAAQVDVCGAADTPLGIATDEAAQGEDLAVALLGSVGSTLQVVAASTITAGTWLVAAANGKAAPLSATPGTYHVIGRALGDASTDGLVAFDPCPHQRTVS